MTKTNIWRLL